MNQSMRSLGACLVLTVLWDANSPSSAEETKPSSPQEKLAHVDRYGDPLPSGALARLGTTRFHSGMRYHVNVKVVFAPDGKTLFSASYNERSPIRQLDAATGREIRALGDLGMGAWLGLSRDGRVLASGSDTVCAWDTETGTKLAELRMPHQDLFALAPDGKTLASSHWSRDPAPGNAKDLDFALHLWDLRGRGPRKYEGLELRKLEGHANWINAVAFAPDGKTLATGSHDKTVRLWEVETGKLLRTLAGHERGVDAVAFAQDGLTLAAGCADHNIYLWDTTNGKEIGRLRGHSGRIVSLVFSPDKQTLFSGADDPFSGGDDPSVRFWDLASGKESRRVPLPRLTYSCQPSLSLAPDGKTLAVGATCIQLLDVATGTEVDARAGHTTVVSAVAYSPDGKHAATGSWDGTIRVWEAATGREVARLSGHRRFVLSVVFSPDGKSLTSAGQDNTLRLWDVATGKELRCQEVPDRRLSNVRFAPDGQALAAACESGTLRLREVATGKEIRRLQGDAVNGLYLAFSPNGKVLASAGERDKMVRFWDVASGKQVLQLQADPSRVLAFDFSPDGRLLATSGTEGKIRLWDAATGKQLLELSGASMRTGCLAFSPDGRSLASGGGDAVVYPMYMALPGDNVVRVWETATGKERAAFKGHASSVTSVAFAPDGRSVISGSHDTTALIWDATGLGREGGKPVRKLSEEGLTALWADLQSAEAPQAARAIWALVAAAEQSLPLLRRRLEPAVPADPEKIARLIADLDSEDFAVRDKASSALAEMAEAAAPALRRALAGKPSGEMRRRAERILDQLTVPTASPERLRTVRALEVLEHIGTAEARQVLEMLAKGAPDAWLTREAKAALERLAKRPGSSR